MNKRRQRLTAAVAAGAAAVTGAAWWSFATTGTGNVGPGAVDALIVFGSPTEINGAASPMQSWRVEEAVAEYRRGAAQHVIFTGGAAANRFVEAEVMAHKAVAAGVPTAAILTERHSRTTIENVRGVSAIMRSHGWTSAELISSADHLPRIAVIARAVPFRWRLHPAPTRGRGKANTALAFAEESIAVLLLRTFGSAAEPVVHAIAVCEHWLLFLPKWVVWKLHSDGVTKA